MKILMFGWELPPHISGGLGTACHGLAKGLASFNDIELTFVIPKIYGDEIIQGIKLVGASDVELSSEILAKLRKSIEKKSFKFSPDITAYITPEQFEKILSKHQGSLIKETKNVPPRRSKSSGQYGNRLLEEVSWYGEVASEIARIESHDVIHAHDWLTYLAGIEAKKILRKPLVVHVHATEYDRSGANHNAQIFEIERKGMALADQVITVSDFTRNVVINKYMIDPSKVVTVHNAVEPVINENIKSKIKKDIDDHIVTFLGRITWQKGPEYFIKAAYKVLQKMNNVRFVMAGSGDLMGNMLKYAARLKIADRFYFTGFLKGDDVFRMYSMSDLFIMPSVSEPFGISALEAIQSNVPVIISKQSGVSEVITHAIKIDFWDIDAIADAIYGILNYSSLAGHLKIKSRKEVKNLSWTDVAARVREIYYKVAYNKAS
jgi:glycosyltransferase involved in cell wall biosynthesis